MIQKLKMQADAIEKELMAIKQQLLDKPGSASGNPGNPNKGYM